MVKVLDNHEVQPGLPRCMVCLRKGWRLLEGRDRVLRTDDSASELLKPL